MTRVVSPFLLVVCLLAVGIAAPDVISVIKPNRSGALNAQLGVPFEGKFTATNVSVADVIAAAHGGALPLDVAHITGLPPWARSERFDIEARSDGAPPTEDSEDDAAIHAAFALVRSMLADRFHLRAHDSSRQEPIYALTETRAGRRPGLKPTVRDCDAIAKAGPFSAPPAGVDPSLWVPCGIRVRGAESLSAGGTLDQLARHLAPLPGIERTVVDRTRIAGRFDFTLAFVPPQPPLNRDGTAAVTDNGPSIFTALQEQLGLKLESTRGPVRVLVIDHLERPTPN
jgi:uncharacterized protein (TIGR03435 family)